MAASTSANIGIHGMEVYVPKRCVDQVALEKHDGVSEGKYTIGLGQGKMAFVGDREDIHSICLTVLQNLLEKHNIDPKDVGRLEVGTETILDKSKSVKSVLMQLFTESGNTDIEGIDTTNACYGGTNAIFNSINWLESSSYDGRYAVVVAGDIAVYAEGNARPTGGCGAVAILLGHDAPVVFEPRVRSSHMMHAYDFYKPNLDSEYPVVDGVYSVECYLTALDSCYARYSEKHAKIHGAPASLSDFDFCVFHSPYGKLVMKSFGRILFNDFRNSPEEERFAEVQEYKDTPIAETYGNKNLERAFIKLSKEAYAEKVEPGMLISNQCGNIYTASVYGGLVSLFSNKSAEELKDKRVMAFSYGSGSAASMFSLKVVGDTTNILRTDVEAMLNARTVVEPADFEATLKLREDTHSVAPYEPVEDVNVTLDKGVYYLTSVDDMYRRVYARTE